MKNLINEDNEEIVATVLQSKGQFFESPGQLPICMQSPSWNMAVAILWLVGWIVALSEKWVHLDQACEDQSYSSGTSAGAPDTWAEWLKRGILL